MLLLNYLRINASKWKNMWTTYNFLCKTYSHWYRIKSSTKIRKYFILIVYTTGYEPQRFACILSNGTLDLLCTCWKGKWWDLPSWQALHISRSLADFKVLFIVYATSYIIVSEDVLAFHDTRKNLSQHDDKK